MVSDAAIYSATIDFSYNQFLVFDSKVALPGCAWTDQHYDQGFARQDHNVCFGTMLEFGYGDVVVHLSGYKGKDDPRARD